MNSKISNISILGSSTVLDALKQMDATEHRLLIVKDVNGDFVSLISIGDVQRYLIKYQDFAAPITKALRNDVRVASDENTQHEIKDMMLKYRVEFMPILKDGKLIRVVFWDDLFNEKQQIQQKKLNLPVVIMAGGKGTRLRPITYMLPKPLIPVGEKPIIQRIVEQFVDAGCQRFLFSVSYKAKMIKAYFDEMKDLPYHIDYFSESKPLGTAGSLSLMKNRINSTFFVSNCDVIIEQDYSEIYKYHVENENELTAVAFVKNLQIPYGTFDVTSRNVLKSLVEKPKFTFLVNAGLYILEHHLLNDIPEDKFFHITHLMDKIIERGGKVGVFPINEGAWLDIGQWKEYQRTLNKFESGIVIE